MLKIKFDLVLHKCALNVWHNPPLFINYMDDVIGFPCIFLFRGKKGVIVLCALKEFPSY